MAKSEAIKIQDGETVIELTGAKKDAFIAQREADQAQALLHHQILRNLDLQNQRRE